MDNLAFWCLNAVKRVTLALNLVFYSDKLRQVLVLNRPKSQMLIRFYRQSVSKRNVLKADWGEFTDRNRLRPGFSTLKMITRWRLALSSPATETKFSFTLRFKLTGTFKYV